MKQCGTIRIMVSRHSAFYTPLIATIAGGFLEREGHDATYEVLRPGMRSHPLIREGVIDIMQSAVSSNWTPMERGETDLPVHFAEINRRDGFFLVGRDPEPAFSWRGLEGRTLLADHGAQPLAMLRFAVWYNGADWTKIRVIDEGAPEQIERAFREGRADFAHLQGPAAQQIEHEAAGTVVASAGESTPPVAFSSLMASRSFLERLPARRFIAAYRKAREWVRQTAAEEIAQVEKAFFPEVPLEALTAAIARYQSLGCWDGGIQIPRDLYEQALEVFLHSGNISRRHPYDEVVVAPPT